MCNEADAEMLSPRHRQLAAVLWDLDGTLIDSRALWEIAYRDLAEQQGIQ
ncbi:MAG: hypothetical protein JO287_16265, partial [Pseudonocardiales bacterium]|nr:hypothetical protein [Pseudonocardiales bacterium]